MDVLQLQLKTMTLTQLECLSLLMKDELQTRRRQHKLQKAWPGILAGVMVAVENARAQGKDSVDLPLAKGHRAVHLQAEYGTELQAVGNGLKVEITLHDQMQVLRRVNGKAALQYRVHARIELHCPVEAEAPDGAEVKALFAAIKA